MVSDGTFHQELEQIQNIIDRLASNSFKVKGWTVTLVVVTLLFRTKDLHLAVAFIPLIGFWYLDAYFLRQEKRFRELYDWVRQNRQDTDAELFNMDPTRVDGELSPVRYYMLNKSLIIFYGTIASLLLIYSAVLISTNMGAING